MKVAVSDIDEGAAAAVAASIGSGAISMDMDVRSEESVEAGIARTERLLGPVDRLAACAGVFGVNPFDEVTRKQWQHTLDVNAWGVYLSLRSVGERSASSVERDAWSRSLPSQVVGQIRSRQTTVHPRRRS